MSGSPPFAMFPRYLAIIFGPGLIGWAISPGEATWEAWRTRDVP